MTDDDIAAALARVEDCLGRERPMDAVADLQAILAARPNHPMAMCGVGRVSIQLGDSKAALGALDIAIAQAPELFEARNARGVAMQNLGRLDEAEAEFRIVADALPDNPGALLNLASLHAAKGNYPAAREAFARVLDLRPDDATAGYNLGLLDLLEGRFEYGWRGFELRHQASNVGLAAVASTRPRWDGRAEPEAVLLVLAEQGLGDNIQFARYFPEVSALVGKVIIEAPGPLVELFEQISCVDRVIAKGDPLPDHDLHIPVMSLPAVFDTGVDTIPWPGAYLRAMPERVAYWQQRFAAKAPAGRLHVGLVWAGNPSHKRDHERSVPLGELEPLLQVPDAAFHALQIGPALDELLQSPLRRTLLPAFRSPRPLSEVAAAVEALDLLIGVDTSLVHLAGAMDRPVWTLVTKVPDWRWMLEREDTPWYPAMRLFRQRDAGNWTAVVEDVASALAEYDKPEGRPRA